MRKPTEPPATTQPGYAQTPGGGASLALHWIYPRELTGLQIPLLDGITLGRNTNSPVPHSTISREHATLLSRPLGWMLEDLQSSNGTRVDGVRLKHPEVIQLGSVVRLGDALAVVDEPRRDEVQVDQRVLKALPGAAAAMQRLRRQLTLAGPDPATVLVLGETGTGKERLARTLHELSGRKGPLIAINCAGIPSQLFESELFGHERGAFTGATTASQGLFRAADGGTLFMDEVGELSLDMQAKLLRALQEGEIRPVGATQSTRVDVRVVAATNRDLRERVEAGEFRRDLHARLSWWELCLPPLRERRVDVFAWLMILYRAWQQQRGAGPELVFTPDAAERILLHPWLDNLRGLERLVHRVCSAGFDGRVGLSMLEQLLPELQNETTSASSSASQDLEPGPSAQSESTDTSGERRAAPRKAPDRAELLSAYEATGGSVRAMAKHFNRDRRQIYRWLERMNIGRDLKETENS